MYFGSKKKRTSKIVAVIAALSMLVTMGIMNASGSAEGAQDLSAYPAMGLSDETAALEAAGLQQVQVFFSSGIETSSMPLLTSDDILGDMTGYHEMEPKGFYQDSGQHGAAIKQGNNPPSGWNYIMPWGQAFEAKDGSSSQNTAVQVTAPKVYILSKSQNVWVEMGRELSSEWYEAQGIATVSGKMYLENYYGDYNKPLSDSWPKTDDTISAVPGSGMVFHFWPSGGRASLYSQSGIKSSSDIAGVFVVFQGRLITLDPNRPDDRSSSRFVMNAGADYWLNLTGNGGLTQGYNPGVGMGKMKLVRNDWQHFTFCTMDAATAATAPLPPGVVKGSSESGSGNETSTPGESQQGSSSTGGSSSSSGSKGGGSGGGGYRDGASSTVQTVDTTTIPSLTTYTTTQLLKMAETALKENGNQGTAIVKLKNPDKLTAAQLIQMAEAAGNRTLQIYADTTDAKGNITARIVFSPAQAQNDICATISISSKESLSTKALFEKWYKNKVTVCTFAQTASFNSTVRVAVVLPSKTAVETLVFYQYNMEKNTVVQIRPTDIAYDGNGYLHFTLSNAGQIIISEGQLVKL
ncbi:MAG: hypothetical protein ACK5LX_08820 [Oscillospiraceae bacterium]